MADPTHVPPQVRLGPNGETPAPGTEQPEPDPPHDQPPPRRNDRRVGLIAGATLVVGAGALAGILFLQPGGDSVGDDTSSPAPSDSDSAAPQSNDPSQDGTGLPADQAIKGDCLDKPEDVTDTKIVDCDSRSAAAEVVGRADDPDADNNTEAAAAECQGTDSDYTIYMLDDDAGSQRFVLCVKDL